MEQRPRELEAERVACERVNRLRGEREYRNAFLRNRHDQEHQILSTIKEVAGSQTRCVCMHYCLHGVKRADG